MGKRLYIAIIAIIAIVAIYQTFNIGYGCADKVIYQSEQTQRNSPTPAPERLTVIYERQMGNSSDLLHLRIDTTYHQIGKGAYKHELRAERAYSLRSFDGTYTDMNDAVAFCFVEGGREWQTEKMQQHNVAGYNCQGATLTIGEMRYQAWYSDSLPHLHQGAQSSDGRSGLILEAQSADMRYSLRAKYIGQRIG